MIEDTLVNPFPGLRPFESNEEHLFFGRDGQSDELLRRLRRNRFLAVLGTSGSGKSSLVRAGLLPSLYGGIMTQAGSSWRVALFRPGHDPIGNLAQALSEPGVLGSDEDGDLQRTITEATLRRSALGLVETTRQARMPANENLLVVVDQFEEIFRFRRTARKESSEDEAAAFIKLLLEAKRQSAVPIYIVITMRSDFLGDCSQFRDLPEAINDGQYLIPRMTRDQRREAIAGPIAVGGGAMSPRLVNRLLNDVGDDPDHLPILQHALMRTWDFWTHHRRDSEPMDLDHYEAVGTMADALSRHADEAYNELPDERSRMVAEKLFKGLTERGPDNREIRRPTRVKEICAVADASEAEVIAVIERFRLPGRSFLMPPTNVALGPESLIDISHESLIRGWERLKKWVDQEARSAQVYRRLAETAALHKEGHAGLWHDPDLALALNWREKNRPNAVWAQHYHPDFDGAMAFLTRSKEASEAEIAEKERQRKREIRRTRMFSMVLGVAFLISLGFGAFAYDARNKAYAARNDALEQRNKADAARNEAVAQGRRAETEKQRAQKSEENALESEKHAQTEKQNAEQAAQVAEQRRKEAQQASERARQAQMESERRRQEAERAAIESARAAQVVRKNLFDEGYTETTLADRLSELSTPQEAAYWSNYKALAYTQMGWHNSSKAESTKVLDTFGDNLSAFTNRGYMNLILGQPDSALRDFQRAKDLDPHNTLNYLNMGVTQGILKDYDAAISSIRAAIDWYRPLYFDGVFESEVSPDIKKATHRTVITADGNALNAALHYELANLEAFRGGADFEARLAEADQHAAKTAPSVEAYLSALNWGWLQLRKEPGDYGAFAAQAHLWQKAGYDSWAKYYYLHFQCEYKKHNDQRYNALAKWVTRQLSQLPKDLGRVDCSTPPENVEPDAIKIFEANALGRLGDYDNALAKFDDLIRGNPNSIELLLLRAKYRKWRGDQEQANSENRKKYWDASQRDFGTALKLAETEVAYRPYVYLMWAFWGKSMGALDDNLRRDYFQKALEQGPASADALSELSDIVAKSNPAEALDLLKRSLQLEQSAGSYYKLAKLQNDSGRYKEALESIKLALSLRDSNSGYYEERERAYKEQERTEEGLHVPAPERKRHLAAGYTEIGDTMLKQLRTSDANRAYKEGQRILSDLPKLWKTEAVAADLAIINSKLARLSEVARTTTILEWTSCRILAIKRSVGPTREVTIDRGSDDGITADEEGSVWSIYSKDGNNERMVQPIAKARVINVTPRAATVEVTMDNPTGNGLVRVGDMVYVLAKVPPLPERSVLWELAKFHITFTSEDSARVHTDYRRLYRQERPELVDEILDAMIRDIRETAKLLADNEAMSKTVTAGSFKGKTLRQAMDNVTREEVLAFLNSVKKGPRYYYGQEWKIGRAWGSWVLSGAPQ
jgi:tetratricopeptide (TPR) repeat protein/energy-coupling factor transporter ATP-binding protein EcfA2